MESTKVKEENAQLSFDQDEKKTEEEDRRKVERKQFSWLSVVIVPLVIVVFLIYIFRKPLKKVSRLF